MEHVVFFSRPDGSPAFRRFPSLEEGARFIEHLRNVEDISDGALFALTAVPLAFKTWYRVEVGAAGAEAPAEAAPAEAPVAEAPVAEAPAVVVEEPTSTVVPVPEPASGPVLLPDAEPVAQVPSIEPDAHPGADADAVAPELARVGGGRHERGLGFFAR